MTQLGMLVVTATIVLVTEIIIRWICHRQAHNLVKLIHARADRPVLENIFSGILLEPKREPEKPPLRITMVAPFGRRKRMTLRSRIIPMASSFIELGYEVNIFVPPWDCPEDSGRKENFFGALNLINVRLGRWTFRDFDPFLFWRLFRGVLASQPDMIYSFKPIRYSGALSLLTYLLKSIPWIGGTLSNTCVVIDVDDWEGFGGWADRIEGGYLIRFMRDRLERLAVRYSDVVTVANRDLENRVRTLRKNSKKIVYIPNGILPELWPEVSDLRPPDELHKKLKQLGKPRTILLYSRFVEIKAEEVITIFGKVLEAVPDAALLVVGTSDDYVSITEKLKLLTLADHEGIPRERIIQVGWVPYHELRNYWSAADVAICPYEDTNVIRARSTIKVLELMAAGKALVAYEVGEIAETIVHGKSGLLVKPNDSDAFARDVVRLLKNKRLRVRIGDAANDRAHHEYDWDKIVEKVEPALIPKKKEEKDKKGKKHQK